MKTRTISAFILLLLMIGSIIISPKLFGILITIFSLIGYNEFFKIRYGKDKKKRLIYIFGCICLLLITMNKTYYKIDDKVLMLFPLLLLSIPIVFYNDSKRYNITDSMYNIGIIYFLGYAFGNIVNLGVNNILLCVFIFVISFITDTYAYIGGMLIGRHKLTTISPKKTIEGSVVGTLMGVLIGSFYYYNLIGGSSLLVTVVCCLILTLLSEIGDLFFSSIKRYYEKKDYSNLIPGHGGILDRFDSVIFVSLGLSLLLSLM